MQILAPNLQASRSNGIGSIFYDHMSRSWPKYTQWNTPEILRAFELLAAFSECGFNALGVRYVMGDTKSDVYNLPYKICDHLENNDSSR